MSTEVRTYPAAECHHQAQCGCWLFYKPDANLANNPLCQCNHPYTSHRPWDTPIPAPTPAPMPAPPAQNFPVALRQLPFLSHPPLTPLSLPLAPRHGVPRFEATQTNAPHMDTAARIISGYQGQPHDRALRELRRASPRELPRNRNRDRDQDRD